MEQFPSYLEHQGYYNVNREEHRNEAFESPYPYGPEYYHQNVKVLPPLTWDEFRAATTATYAALEKFGRMPGHSDPEAKSFYEFCVGDGLSDRSLQVQLPDVGLLTPELVLGLQREVLGSRPLWRVTIVNSSPETFVVIYPTVVWIGSLVAAGNWKADLVRVVELERALREPREGPQLRQYAYLKQRITELLRHMYDHPFQLVAAFDNWRGDNTNVTVWFLFQGPDSSDLKVKEPADASGGEAFPVKDDGDFGRHHQTESSPIWLREWVLPKDFGVKLNVQRYADFKPIPEAIYTVDIPPSSIITDSSLKNNPTISH